jgi:hypothetical protein
MGSVIATAKPWWKHRMMTTVTRKKSQMQTKTLARFLPIIRWLPNYQRAWLGTDLIAGLTVVALLIPEGMAYAQIAGVPPQTAFYAAPIGLLAFAIFGSSRQLGRAPSRRYCRNSK